MNMTLKANDIKSMNNDIILVIISVVVYKIAEKPNYIKLLLNNLLYVFIVLIAENFTYLNDTKFL